METQLGITQAELTAFYTAFFSIDRKATNHIYALEFPDVLEHLGVNAKPDFLGPLGPLVDPENCGVCSIYDALPALLSYRRQELEFAKAEVAKMPSGVVGSTSWEAQSLAVIEALGVDVAKEAFAPRPFSAEAAVEVVRETQRRRMTERRQFFGYTKIQVEEVEAHIHQPGVLERLGIVISDPAEYDLVELDGKGAVTLERVLRGARRVEQRRHEKALQQTEEARLAAKISVGEFWSFRGSFHAVHTDDHDGLTELLIGILAKLDESISVSEEEVAAVHLGVVNPPVKSWLEWLVLLRELRPAGDELEVTGATIPPGTPNTSRRRAARSKLKMHWMMQKAKEGGPAAFVELL